jgi:hypothetical protein
MPEPVTRAERRWALKIALLILLLTSLPYLLAYFQSSAEWRYSGFIFGVEDGNSYIAKMLRGAAGDWLFRSPYTAYPQSGMLAYLPFLLLGKLTSAPGQHEQLVVLFHAFRWLGGVLSILATYEFIAVFIRPLALRRWGTLLAALGGGLGWLSLLGLDGLWAGRLPLEYYSPEAFGFLEIYGLPHLAFARACLLYGLVLLIRPRWPDSPIRSGLLSGAAWLLLGLMQPLTILIGWAVAGVFLVGRWALGRLKPAFSSPYSMRFRFLQIAAALLLSAPLVLYNFLAFQSDPFLSGWLAQNLILSPPPGDFLLAYGLLLIPALFGALLLFRTRAEHALLPLAWLLLFPLLAYAPYNLQRRLTESFWIILCILSLVAIDHASHRIKRWLPALSISFLPSLLILGMGVAAALQPQAPLFRPAAEVRAFEFLNQQAAPGDVVLAAYKTSNPLPAWAPVTVLVGVGPESVGQADLLPRITAFYQAETPDTASAALLEEFHVKYVFYGPEEAALGSWLARSHPVFSLIYEKDGCAIYAVKQGD